MSLADNILDPSRLCLRGTFEDQVNYLLSQLRLTRGEVEGYVRVFEDLEYTLGMEFRGCKVYPFGSVVTGLGIRTSDIDCYIDLPVNANYHDKRTVMKAKQLLSRNYEVFTDLFAIPNAKVPIVKFFHIPTQRHCDINFKSPAGVENSKLVGFLLHLDSRALPLAVLLKYWSKMHNLTGTNLVPNYALTMLVIFYLQQKNILPSVELLQRDNAYAFIQDIWNTGFQRIQFATINGDTLYELLGGFFLFYSTFDFESQIISTYLGQAITKDLFKDLRNVPPEYCLYKNNVRQRLCPSLKTDSTVCIQDPFEHSRNCSVGVYPKLANKLVLFFQAAAKAFTEKSNNNFLHQILIPTPNINVPSMAKPRNNAQTRVVPTTSKNNHRGITKAKHQNQQISKKKGLTIFAQYANFRKNMR